MTLGLNMISSSSVAYSLYLKFWVACNRIFYSLPMQTGLGVENKCLDLILLETGRCCLIHSYLPRIGDVIYDPSVLASG